MKRWKGYFEVHNKPLAMRISRQRNRSPSTDEDWRHSVMSVWARRRRSSVGIPLRRKWHVECSQHALSKPPDALGHRPARIRTREQSRMCGVDFALIIMGKRRTISEHDTQTTANACDWLTRCPR